MLARACNTQSSPPWPEYYCQLMKGGNGENIQATRGLELIRQLADKLRDQERPIDVDHRSKQLVIRNYATFEQVSQTAVR